MRTGLFICAAVLAAAAGLHASQDQKKSDADKPVITVTGCVDGSWLQVRKTDRVGTYTERYRLRGSKQVLKELAAQYKWHLIEVTGAVTDTVNTTHRGKTVQVGKKTRIYTGAKDVPQVPSGNDPTLEVASYRDLKESCR
jgi:hypothetical protein